MKLILAALLLASTCFTASAQNNSGSRLLKYKSKTHTPIYVELNDTEAKVFYLSNHLDVAGRGYALASTDTLAKKTDGRYEKGPATIITENEKSILLLTTRKGVNRYALHTVTDMHAANNDLNNAYHCSRYFELSDKLNKTYPLYHYSFREAYGTWKTAENKEIDYVQFREWTDRRISVLRDSLTRLNDSRTATTDFLLKNIRTIDYPALKEKIQTLPAEYAYQSQYFTTVANAVAKEKPEYFLRLAEDLPESRQILFQSVDKTRPVFDRIRAVEGYAAVKKAFFDERAGMYTGFYKK
ncbi:hypothetical protein EGT74_16900 [Chitinophaga lutea]|uniref:DUF4369 domain-containing protein n=1 Tax=Chitinophaga lutea TaxID=2488634 RepID=A0A3N4QAE8_9BACT|nr:hypothetical protein [Chitinophaga lutea]RPE08714.1 hypothetical protein EGT74_16900 [Chitinophaga lutea]